MHAALLDRACQAQLRALAAAPIRQHSSAEEVRAKQEGLWTAAQLGAGFEYLVRRADAVYGPIGSAIHRAGKEAPQ
jgi:hypothetical protein